MMPKKNIVLIMVGLIILCGCSQSSFMANVIRFDQAFIPAYYYTGLGKKLPAQSALKLLRKEWENFSISYYNFMPRDREWKEDLSEIDEKISIAIGLVNKGKGLELARKNLEKIRNLAWRMRQRNGIKYYLDQLNDFDEVLEAMLLIVNRKIPPPLNDTDLQNLRWLVDRGLVLWQKAAKSEFNHQLFGFNQKKIKLMKSYFQAESVLLVKARKIIIEGDKRAIIQNANGLKPNFTKLYLLFGDFNRLKPD